MTKKKDNIPPLLKTVRWLFPRLERWAPFLSERIFRLVFYVPLKYSVPEKEMESAKSAKQFDIPVDGKKIHVYSWGAGSGPFILLIHGWAGRATQFRKFVKPLNEAGFRVIGFDGPSHGRSEGVRTSILEFERALQEIFKVVGIPEAVITHSFGGAAALYSAMNGLAVRKLINIASPSIADEILKTYLRAINGSWPSAERFKVYVKRRTGRSFEEFTSLYTIKHLAHPIDLLIVQDEDDGDVYAMHAYELQKAYPSAKLFITKGLGHTRVLKDESVIAACLDFIKSK